MRIRCPFCGVRDLSEFAYYGDASFQRPSSADMNSQTQFFEAVYLRVNPAGRHEELWYHTFGCRSWLRVSRDTCTHEILATAFVHPVEVA